MSAAVSRAGFVGSVVALLTATCCILPLALVLLGLGGSWIAVFGIVAAASLQVTGLAAALTVTGDRKSVVSGKSVSVRVDLRGRRIMKQKKITCEESRGKLSTNTINRL